MSARIRGADTELKELGEDADEFTETTSKLRGLVMGLTGFDIMKDKNNFKDIYDIILGIGEKWDELTDVQRASLGEALAGKRNANALYAVLGNLDTLQDAYATAENAAGSAAKEQENYSKSVQYSIDRAKASLQELAYDFLNSDLLKGIVDIGNSAINTIDEIVKHMGGIVPIITTIAGGILSGKNKFSFVEFTQGTSEAAADLKLFGISLTDVKTKFSEFYDTVKNKGFKEAFKGLFSKENMISQSDIQNVQKFCDEIDNGGDVTVAFAKNLKNCDGAVKDYVRDGLKAGKTGKEIAAGMQTATVSSKAATIAVKAFNVALSAIGGLVIGKIISAIVEGIDNLIHSTDRAKEKLEESVDELESLKDELEDVNEELDNNKARIEELQSLGSLTYVEEQELQKLQAATEELEAQKKLKEWQIRNQQKEVANEALDLYDKEFKDLNGQTPQSIAGAASHYGNGALELDSMINNAERNAQKNRLIDNLAFYKRLTEVVKEGEESLRGMAPDSAEYESTDKKIGEVRSAIDTYEQAISEKMGDLIDVRNDLEGEYYSIVEEHPDLTGLSSTEETVVNTYNGIIEQLEYMYDLMGLINDRGTGEGARDTAGVVQHFSERAGRALSLNEQQGIQGALGSLDEDQYNTAINFTDEQWKAVDASIQKVKQSTGEAVLSNEEYVKILTSAVEKANDVAIAEAKAATESKTLEETLQSLGSSTEAFEAYVATLKTISPEFAHNDKAARDFALAQLAVDNAVADLSSNLEDYIYKLQNADRTSSDYAMSLNSLAADLSKLTGKEVSIYDAEQFASDARNIQLLKDALAGVEGAFDELKARFGAASGIIKITPGMDLSQFNADFDSFIDFINAHADLGELDVSAGLDTGDFYTVLQQVISSSEQAAEAVKSYFNQLGWDMKFDWDSIDIPVPHAAAGPKGGTQSAYNEARAEQNSLNFVNAQMKIPTNFRLVSKNGTTITPPSSGGGGSSSGGSGGGGSSGGGGGGSSSSPTDSVQETIEDAVDDTANDILQAALDAINKISERWEQTIYMMQDQINDIQFAIDQMTNNKEIATLSDKSVKGMWRDIFDNYHNLQGAQEQLAGGYSMKATEMQAELDKQVAAGAIAVNSKEYYDVQHQIMETANAAQDAMLASQQANIAWLEMLKERREDRTTGFEKIVDKFRRVVDKFGKAVDRYFHFQPKNRQINSQLSANQDLIDRTGRLATRYRNQSDRLGKALPNKLRKQIDEGFWNPRKVKDGYVLKQALEYEEWITKIQETDETLKELYDTQSELIQQKIDNVLNYYQKMEDYLNSFLSKLDAAINLKNAKGQRTSLTDILGQYDAQDAIVKNAAESRAEVEKANAEAISDINKKWDDAVDQAQGHNEDRYKRNETKIDKLEKKQDEQGLNKKQTKTLNRKKKENDWIDQYYAEGANTPLEIVNAMRKLQKLEKKEKNGTLTKKEQKQLNNIRAKLDGWQKAQEKQLLDIEGGVDENGEQVAGLRKEELDQQAIENEQRLNEQDAAVFDAETKGWEFLKQIAEYQLEELKEIGDDLKTIVSNYQTLAKLVDEYDPEMLASYGLTDYLGTGTAAVGEYILSGLNAAGDAIQNSLNRSKVAGEMLKAQETGDFSYILDYVKQNGTEEDIERVNRAIEELNSNGKDAVTFAREWRQEQADANAELSSNVQTAQELKDQFRENVILKETNLAIAALERQKSILSSMINILPTMFESDVNGLTPVGLSKIGLLSETWNDSVQSAEYYAQQLKKIDESEANFKDAGYQTKEEWQAARTEAINNYYKAIQEGESASQQIYELGYKARQAEIDQLKRLVDARKDALNAQKAMYEYSRRHSDAQKTVDELQAQIDALNGVSDAASKAKMKQLQSDLADAQQNLTDMEMDHQFELSTQALDDLVTKASEAIDTTLMNFSETVQFFSEVVDEYSNASKNVSSQWVNDSTIQFFADGVSKVLTSAVENLSKENLLKNPDYTSSTGATYTPLSQEEFVSTITTSTVSPELFTEQISNITNSLDTVGKFLEKTMQPQIAKIAQDLEIVADIDLNFQDMIHIDGNTDSVTYERMKNELTRIMDQVSSMIISSLGKAGIKRKY